MANFQETLSKLKLPFTLAEKQVQTIEELSQHDRVALLLDTGAGKTVCGTVLAAMYGCDVSLILVPPILIPQWVKWLKEVDPTSTVKTYYGPSRKLEDMDADWVVTSHAIFRQDHAKFTQRMLKRSVTVLVDEAQALKNVSSKLYRYVKMFAAGQHLILMTATPTSKPEDAYSYVSLKTPKVYRSMGHFEQLHVVDRDFFGAANEYRDLDVVSNNLMLQAKKLTKEDMFAGMLNPPVYQTISYKLAPAHAKLYEQLVDECILELGSSGQKIDGTTPSRLYHLVQQMILGWAFFADDPGKRPAGLDILDNTIEETGCLRPERSKLIVWTYYQRSSELITKYLNSQHPGSTVAAYGAVNSAKSVQKFMFDPATRILVAQPLSVGMGLNAMTVCHEMLFLEFSTVSMHVRQSIGRVDRMGQTKIPNIRFAVAEKTVQSKLLENLFKNDAVVSAIERNVQTLRAALLGG